MDTLADIRGESMTDGMDNDPTGAPPDPSSSFLATLLAVWNAPFVAAAGFGSSVVETGGSVITGAQDTFGGAVEDVSEAANPANLLGLGTGVAFGGIMAATGLAIVGAFAADQLFFAGMGTRSLVARVVSR